MRCSDCGCAIKPVVAVDIDGTLGDYHGHFLQFARDYDNTYYPLHYDGSVELHEHMGISLEHYRGIKLAYRQGGGKRMMPCNAGAGHLLGALRAQGAEVWLTTTRPYNRFDSTDPDTRHWLERHGLEWDHLLYDGDKYNELAARIDYRRVVGVLDDLPDMLEQAVKNFPDAQIVWKRNAYNAGMYFPGVTVSHLRQAYNVFSTAVKEWYGNTTV